MTAMELTELAPGYLISRVIRGGWQLAGGHGVIDRRRAVADLLADFAAGITAFDCADIYQGVEETMGALRAALAARHGAAALARLRVHTKCVPDLDRLARLTRADIAAGIDRSLRRLGVDRLDLVQFHWWDYAVEGWIEAAQWLTEQQKAGKVTLIGATNFDRAHLQALLDAGVPIRALQVQYSLLDDRPAGGLAQLCAERGVALLCYGSVAGGFLGERWLGRPAPAEPLENRSLVKYRLIIEEFGGWELFQRLLAALAQVGRRHGAGIAEVAGAYVLERPAVGAVIVGARNRTHLAANLRTASLRLTGRDRDEIAAVLALRQGPSGEVYGLERDRTGRHGAIMNYNLNR